MSNKRELHATCITDGCDQKQRSRGLCNRCYVAASNLIARGRTSWLELEKNGLCHAPQPVGTNISSLFRLAFDKAEKGNGKPADEPSTQPGGIPLS